MAGDPTPPGGGAALCGRLACPAPDGPRRRPRSSRPACGAWRRASRTARCRCPVHAPRSGAAVGHPLRARDRRYPPLCARRLHRALPRVDAERIQLRRRGAAGTHFEVWARRRARGDGAMRVGQRPLRVARRSSRRCSSGSPRAPVANAPSWRSRAGWWSACAPAGWTRWRRQPWPRNHPTSAGGAITAARPQPRVPASYGLDSTARWVAA